MYRDGLEVGCLDEKERRVDGEKYFYETYINKSGEPLSSFHKIQYILFGSVVVVMVVLES
jgi:hypothetical protein